MRNPWLYITSGIILAVLIVLWFLPYLACWIWDPFGNPPLHLWNNNAPYWFPVQIVSQSSSKALANDASGPATTSSDGRYVTFVSQATNLAAQSGILTYVHDTCGGPSAPATCTPKTTLVTVAQNPGNCGSAPQGFSRPSISGNGRYIAFQALGCLVLIVNGGTSVDTSSGHSQIFLRDTCIGAAAGCVPSTAQITVLPPDGIVPGPGSQRPSISADGRYIAFVSNSANLAFDRQANPPLGSQVYVTDVSSCEGALGLSSSCFPTFIMVSQNASGQQSSSSPSENGASCPLPYVLMPGTCDPQISPGGRFVAFISRNTNLGADGKTMQLFVGDSCLINGGAVPNCTVQAYGPFSMVSGALANADVIAPSIDSSGRFLAFSSKATNLSPPATSGNSQVYFADDCSIPPARHCPTSVTLLSDHWTAVSYRPPTLVAGNGDSGEPFISANAADVVFQSTATNLLPDITSGTNIYEASTCVGISACLQDPFIALHLAPCKELLGNNAWPILSADNGALIYTSDAKSGGLAANPNGTPLVYYALADIIRLWGRQHIAPKRR